MTWQDELQYWEAELAAGRISPEEYRTRCELVRARAPEQSAPQAGDAGQPGPNPFPPPFTWSNAAAQATNGQPPATNGQPPGGEESTQVIPSPLDGLRTAASNDFQTGTVALPQEWNTSASPGPQGPRVVAEPPASTGHNAPTWTRPGPEVFDSATKRPRAGVIVGVVIGAVVLLVAVGLVLAFFVFPGSTPGLAPGPVAGPSPVARQPLAPAQLAEPPAPRPTPPADSRTALIPVVPGPAHPFDGAFSPADLSGNRTGLLPPQIRDFAQQSGMADGWFRGTSGSPTISLIAIRMPNQDAATGLEQQYLAGQDGLSVDNSLSYQGVKVMTTGGTIRTAYVTYQYTIIIEVTAPTVQAAHDQFKTVLDRQLTQSPPTVRG